YFRLKVDFPLEYAISPETSDRPETWQPGRVIELSARGLKMLIDAPLLPDTQVSLRFRLPAPPTPMAIQGIVLRVVEQHEHKTLLVAFYPDVPEKWRDAIMQYLTIAQRAMLRGERVP
ncbi:MAG: PilZ domain-containing protein, partial [candidate division Zixibacteria bacterium]|nr:PilZ domain-containing protein [candidate division Zixibacteria bacterium]